MVNADDSMDDKTSEHSSSSSKNVNFAPNVSIAYVPEEVGTWYTKEEFSNLRQDHRSSVERLIERPYECSIDKDFCPLGLKTAEELDRDMGVRYFAFQLVMTEQDTQQHKESFDADQIAEAYLCVTSYQQTVAEKRAAALAAELY